MTALLEQDFIRAPRFGQAHVLRLPAFPTASRQQSVEEEKE
jgi:hypothetical protein